MRINYCNFLKSLIPFLFLFEVNVLPQETTYQNLYYEISPIYNFKQSILSITFDDGELIQFTKAVPLLNERNIPATFYIPTYTLKDAAFRNIVYEAYLAHHEIGSHTVNHPVLSDLDKPNVEFELSQSQKDINSVLGENRCLTFAYPGGQYNDSVLQIVKKYYLAARTVFGGYNSMRSLNRYELSIKCFEEPTAALLNNCANYAANHELWLIEVFHGMDNIGYTPVNSTEFSNHLDYVKTLEDKMWFATVSNVIKYYDESKNATLSCDECNDSIYKLRLNDNLDDSIYDQPLSLKIRVPDNWGDDIQLLGAQFIKTLLIDSNKFLLFNAIPNNHLITVKPSHIGVLKFQPAVRFLSLDPNPFVDNIDVAFEVVNPPFDVYISVVNTDGKKIYNEKVNCSVPIINLHINTNKFSKGLYLFKVIVKDTPNKLILVRKLIKF